MENPEEVLQLLERFTKLKQKEIPRELDDYLSFVARTGDTVYRWAIVKHLFREKLLHVITDFRETTPSISDLPQCPNVDRFNYERTRRTLLDRLDAFNSAPFTVQRICELLTEPRKQYTRIDKFMRAVEKNILVVSTQEPGRRRSDSENGDSLDSIVNGELEVNVDIEMDNEAFAVTGTNETMTTNEQTAPTSSEATSPVPPGPEQEEPKDVKVNVDTSVAVETDKASSSENELENDDLRVPLIAQETGTAVEGPETTDSSENDTKSENVQSEVQTNTEQLVSDEKPEPALESAQPLDLIQTVPKELNSSSDLHPTKETPADPDEKINSPKPGEDACTIPVDPVDQPVVDDDQPQAKLAKLSEDEDKVTPEAGQLPENESKIEADDISKDDLSSASTTDSGSSSTSVDSEPISSSTDVSASNSAEAIESFDSSTDNLQNAPIVSNATPDVDADQEPKEIIGVTPQATETSEASPDMPLDAAPPTTQHSVTKSVTAADEMETAVSSTLVAENIMATDEEETIQSSTDAVVPMAADVPEITKSDDNAMDVDESSVEPMDQ